MNDANKRSKHGSRREIFHMFRSLVAVFASLHCFRVVFFCIFHFDSVVAIGCWAHFSFSFALSVTGVTFKRFRHLSFAWKRILHSWWTSGRNMCALFCDCCCCCFFALHSSTAWITVLRSDKQALCEVQVFFFTFFGTSFFACDSLKWSTEREEEEKGLYHQPTILAIFFWWNNLRYILSAWFFHHSFLFTPSLSLFRVIRNLLFCVLQFVYLCIHSWKCADNWLGKLSQKTFARCFCARKDFHLIPFSHAWIVARFSFVFFLSSSFLLSIQFDCNTSGFALKWLMSFCHLR